MAQLRWLKQVYESEKTVTILVTHDNDRFDALTRSGAIGGELKL